MSQPTLDAMTAHLQLEAEIGGYEAAAAASGQIAEVYTALAELLGGSAEEVALFDNATHAWNAAFYSIPLSKGDRILTGRAEYGSNVMAYLQVAARTGAEVVVAPNDEHGQLDVAALADLTDKRTRVIGVAHIPTNGGLVNPAAEIGRIAQASGALFLLDATQSAGQMPLDVEELGCDLLTGTGRKFLRGPRGTGFLWVRTSILDRLDPPTADVDSATWQPDHTYRWVDGARRLAAWEQSYITVLGLGSAVRQALDLGLDAIQERVFGLGARLREQLEALPGVSVHDLGQVRCAIVTAKVDGVPSQDVMAALTKNGINARTTVPTHTPYDNLVREGVHPLVRLSPHYYNTEAELDRAVEVIAGLSQG